MRKRTTTTPRNAKAAAALVASNSKQKYITDAVKVLRLFEKTLVPEISTLSDVMYMAAEAGVSPHATNKEIPFMHKRKASKNINKKILELAWQFNFDDAFTGEVFLTFSWRTVMNHHIGGCEPLYVLDSIVITEQH